MNLKRSKENVAPRKDRNQSGKQAKKVEITLCKRPLVSSDNNKVSQLEAKSEQLSKALSGETQKSKLRKIVTRKNSTKAKVEKETPDNNFTPKEESVKIPSKKVSTQKATLNAAKDNNETTSLQNELKKGNSKEEISLFKKPRVITKSNKRKRCAADEDRISNKKFIVSGNNVARFNSFGFTDDSEEEVTLRRKCDTCLSEFDPGKPYRLSLYVHLSRPRNLNATEVIRRVREMAPSINISNISCLSPCRSETDIPLTASTPKVKPKRKFIQTKITDSVILSSSGKKSTGLNLSMFSHSTTTDEDETIAVTKIRTNDTIQNGEKRVDNTEINFTKPSRRSYVKRTRVQQEPIEDEPSSDDVFKELDKIKKKKKKTKPKPDKDFEAWSKSMNSQFDEIDKFEISFH